jgi:hypothetical protein
MSLDEQFAQQLKAKGCSHCKGPLNCARYQRKSRSPFETKLPEGWNTFYGLCCSKEGCRRRVRPRSIRYGGRSPHSSGVLLLCQLLRTGGAQRAVGALCKQLRVSERTVRRWLRFWKVACRKSKWWRELGGRFALSGGSVIDLFECLNLMHSLLHVCEIVAEASLNLWSEIKINVGDRIHAKDA